MGQEFRLGRIITTFFHGLGLLTCSGIDTLPPFLRASTISSSSRFIFEGLLRESGIVHSFKMVDPVLFVFEGLLRESGVVHSFKMVDPDLFVFGFHILYSRV